MKVFIIILHSFDHFFSLYEENNNKLWSIYGEGKITKDELNDLRFAHPLLCVGVKDKQLIANYRLKYPESSLQELSEIISIETPTKLTKSGIYHRLRKVKELASKINEQENQSK